MHIDFYTIKLTRRSHFIPSVSWLSDERAHLSTIQVISKFDRSFY